MFESLRVFNGQLFLLRGVKKEKLVGSNKRAKRQPVKLRDVSSNLTLPAWGGLEIVPAWSHKPNDGGAIPPPETCRHSQVA